MNRIAHKMACGKIKSNETYNDIVQQIKYVLSSLLLTHTCTHAQKQK